MNYYDQTDERLQAILKEIENEMGFRKKEIEWLEKHKGEIENEIKAREIVKCKKCQDSMQVRDLGIDGVCGECGDMDGDDLDQG